MAISSPAANCISTWVASPIKSGPPLLRTGPPQDWLAPAFEVRRHSAGPSGSSNCASGACPCYEGFVEEIEHFVTHCILEGKRLRHPPLVTVYNSINTAADRAGIRNVPDVGEASGCSGAATTNLPGFGMSTFAVIDVAASRFTTTTARFPVGPTNTV